jgi:hypothetical protein
MINVDFLSYLYIKQLSWPFNGQGGVWSVGVVSNSSSTAAKRVFLSIYGATARYRAKASLFGFEIYLDTHGRTPWMSDQLIARPLPT